MIEDLVTDLVDTHIPEESHPEEWDLRGLEASFSHLFSTPVNFRAEGEDDLTLEALHEFLLRDTHSCCHFSQSDGETGLVEKLDQVVGQDLG